MIDLRLGLNRSCDRVTRRDFLRVGSLTRARCEPSGLLTAQGTGVRRRAQREVSCVLIWLQGGISHIDSFDPKPQAPEEIRGEFGAIATNVPGISLCDPCPIWRNTRISTRFYGRSIRVTGRTEWPTRT